MKTGEKQKEITEFYDIHRDHILLLRKRIITKYTVFEEGYYYPDPLGWSMRLIQYYEGKPVNTIKKTITPSLAWKHRDKIEWCRKGKTVHLALERKENGIYLNGLPIMIFGDGKPYDS